MISPMTLQHVSSSPSEITYGGFSPVRLQINIPPRPSPSAHTRRRLIRGPQSVSPDAAGIPSLGKPHSMSRWACAPFLALLRCLWSVWTVLRSLKTLVTVNSPTFLVHHSVAPRAQNNELHHGLLGPDSSRSGRSARL